ncbi:MAG: Helix-turn-helix domain [Thermoplasmata archaeon]|nr:Helix-turn-helix domain [Thermoplasmata archaeon]
MSAGDDSIPAPGEKRQDSHPQALLRKTGLAKGALEHHLHALVAAGHLRKVANGGYTCYFVGAPVRGASALKSDGARRLLLELQTHPGVGLVEAASASGLSPATASHHLARLEEAGLVTSLREGRSRRLFPKAAAASAA